MHLFQFMQLSFQLRVFPSFSAAIISCIILPIFLLFFFLLINMSKQVGLNVRVWTYEALLIPYSTFPSPSPEIKAGEYQMKNCTAQALICVFGYGSNLSRAIDAAGDCWWFQPLFHFSEISRLEQFKGCNSPLKHPY